MADKKGLPSPPDKRSHLEDTLADANLRFSGTPVQILRGSRDGTYWPAKGSPYGQEQINITTPEGGSGMDALGIVKHEALHQFFNQYPDADMRMRSKILKSYQGMFPGALGPILPLTEVGPHALMHLPEDPFPQDYSKQMQQALLDVAQGPEQKRHMQALVSMIPPEALTQALRDRSKVYYNAYQPDIQRSLLSPPETPATPASGNSIINRLLGR